MWELDNKEDWWLRTDAFKLWCWRLLRVPWMARRPNQSILTEINPEYLLEGLMLSWCSKMLATRCKEPTHWKTPWYWERLRARGERGNRRWDGWMASLTQWTWVWVNSRGCWRTGRLDLLQPMASQNWTWLRTEQPQQKQNLSGSWMHLFI